MMLTTSENPFPTAIRHVVWDWNGTLIDDVDVFVNSLNAMLRRRRLHPVDREAYRDQFDFPVRDYYRNLGFDLENEDWDALTGEFHTGLTSANVAGVRPDTVPLLRDLQAAGVGMSVLSALEQGRLETALGDAELMPFFAFIRGSLDLNGHSKLERGHELSRLLALPPETICLVGDTTHDHQVAHALGWHCVLLDAGHHSRRRLEPLGRPVFSQLRQVGAHLRQLIINPST